MRKNLIIIALCLLYVASLVSSLNSLEIRGAEPKRAIVSMEMVLSGEYILPTIHGEPYYNKPPLFNWIQVFFFRLFGSFEEPVCRLPGIISLLATGLLIYHLAQYLFDKQTGIYSGFIFLTSADLYLYGSVVSGSVDIFLTLLVFIQVGSILYFYKKRNFLLLFLVSYVFAALGFLAKGLPSIAIQVITLLILCLHGRCLIKLITLRHLAGITAFAIIILLYFWMFSRKDDITSLLLNLFTEANVRYQTSKGVSTYLLQFLQLPNRLLISQLMPWSLVLIFLLFNPNRKNLQGSQFFKLLLWLTLGNAIFYFLSTQYHNRYIYPFLPFMAMILARIFTACYNEKHYLFLTKIFTGIFAILTFGSVSFIFIEPLQQVNGIFIKSLVYAILFAALTAGLLRYRLNLIYGLVIGMILIRFMIPGIYLPAQQDVVLFRYTRISEVLLTLTGNEQIKLTGKPHVEKVALELGSIRISRMEKTISLPPVIPDQISYCLTKETGEIMMYETTLIPGEYYLIYEEYLPESGIEILYSFDDNFWGKKLVLFQAGQE